MVGRCDLDFGGLRGNEVSISMIHFKAALVSQWVFFRKARRRIISTSYELPQSSTFACRSSRVLSSTWTHLYAFHAPAFAGGGAENRTVTLKGCQHIVAACGTIPISSAIISCRYGTPLPALSLLSATCEEQQEVVRSSGVLRHWW